MLGYVLVDVLCRLYNNVGRRNDLTVLMDTSFMFTALPKIINSRCFRWVSYSSGVVQELRFNTE